MTDPLRFYLDASIPIAVSQALALVRSDIEYPGKPGCPIERADTKDPIWLPIVGEAGWVVIMRDKKTKHRPAERAAVLQYGVKAFSFTTAGNLTKWATLSLLVAKWPTLELLATTEEPPFLYAITTGAPRRIDLTS